MYTDYDEKRYKLKDSLMDCLVQAVDLMNPEIWGYNDMRNNYPMEVYKAIKDAMDTV